MRLVPAEFAPDQATLSEFTDYILNAVPYTKRSYRPIGTLGEVGNALDSMCLGAASWRGTDGSVVNVAGDSDDLYRWDGTNWNSVNETSVTYNVAVDDKWAFPQFGNTGLALNGTDPIAKWDIGVSTEFAEIVAASGSVPVAKRGFIVGDFFVVGGIAGNLNRVQWPDINTLDEWAFGQASAQDIPIGGNFVNAVGGEYGRIFMDTAIYGMTFVGPPNIFQFDPISLERGCDAAGSISSYQGSIFFHAPDGFWLMGPDGGLTPIGDQKIDKWFSDRVDRSYLYNIVSTVDPVAKIYYVAYPTLADGSGRCVEMLLFNWTIGRWALVQIEIDYLFGARTNLGYTLDSLDSLYPNLDTMPISLDSVELTGSLQQTLAVFTQNNKMAFFGSSPMTAYFDTVEGDLFEGYQAFVQGIRPLVEVDTSASITATVGRRNRLNDPHVWGPEVTQNAQGRCPQRSQGRYQRARIKVTGAWTDFEGCDIEAKQAGRR